jgi:hypothetical protein
MSMRFTLDHHAIAIAGAAASASFLWGGALWLLVASVAPAAAAASGGEGAETPALVRQALARALSVDGARIDGAVEERAASRPSACRITEAEAPRAVDGSGRVAVKLIGRKPGGDHCEAWTWVRVRVVAPVAVSTRALHAGDPLSGGAIITEERELRSGHPPAQITPGSVAARAINSGQVLEANQVSAPTARLGETLTVLVVSGALTIEQSGRAVPCERGRTCAILPSGKRVQGDLVDGRLVVESP